HSPLAVVAPAPGAVRGGDAAGVVLARAYPLEQVIIAHQHGLEARGPAVVAELPLAVGATAVALVGGGDPARVVHPRADQAPMVSAGHQGGMRLEGAAVGSAVAHGAVSPAVRL